MIFYFLFQIFISWVITCCILKLFNLVLSASHNEAYREPVLLTSLLAVVDIHLSLKNKLMAGRILHHTIGLCFTSIYYLIWYYEFAEISMTMSFIIGFIISLLNIISWTFLLEIIPAVRLVNFKGYYLQLVFVHSIFTILSLTIYWLLL
jgi:hypothetical protein